MNVKPKKSKADIAHSIVKASVSLVPVVGSSASEIFSLIITSPLEKRRDEWIESIATKLLEIEKKVENFNIDRLSENSEFITTLIYSSQVALRNHQIEKIKALENIVLNEALSINIEQDKKLMFINFIDTLTSSHLILLYFLHNPRAWASEHNIKYPEWRQCGTGSAIEYAINEFKGKREFYDQLGQELYSRGLLISANFHNTITVDTALSKHTTKLGEEFLKYIDRPEF